MFAERERDHALRLGAFDPVPDRFGNCAIERLVGKVG